MLYVRVNRHITGAPLSAKIMTNEEMKAVHASAETFPHDIENRNDWKTFTEAETIARLLNRSYEDLHTTYQATDAGAHVHPRYDVIDLPQIGDEVSYAFNGDSYPCGKIVSISKGPDFRRIVAEDASGKYAFNRRCRDGKPTGGAWVMNGTWSLVQGRVSKRNREF